MLGRLLMLSVHRDDECLSCGGLLLQHKDSIHIHYFNIQHPLVDLDTYNKEAEAVQSVLRCTVSYSGHMQTNELHTFPLTVFISEIEKLINTYKPDTVILPARSYNQDHRTIFDAATTALRVHDQNWFVRNIIIAEQPETHTPARLDTVFTPRLFVPIDIEKKLDLYHLYHSQQRGHRTNDHLRHLAGMRGLQCNSPYAEAFDIVRMVT